MTKKRRKENRTESTFPVHTYITFHSVLSQDIAACDTISETVKNLKQQSMAWITDYMKENAATTEETMDGEDDNMLEEVLPDDDHIVNRELLRERRAAEKKMNKVN